MVVRARRTPDQIRADASTRVNRLRAAIDLLGEGDVEEKRVLELSLQKAEQQAEALPLSRQIAATKEFIERAKKRIPAADEKISVARVALQDALDEKEYDSRQLPLAEARLERLLTETAPLPPAEVTTQDLGDQVTSLQQMVNQLQAERDALAARVPETSELEVGGVSPPSARFHRGGGFGVRPCIETTSMRGGNPVNRTGIVRVVVLQAVGAEGCVGDGRDGDLQGSGAFDRLWFGEVRQHANFHGDPHGHMKAVQVIDHQCGLLGCRVGEASHPGPVQTRSARRFGEVYPDRQRWSAEQRSPQWRRRGRRGCNCREKSR